MNKYNAYMMIDAEVKPIFRELFLIVKMSGCPKITIIMNWNLKGTEVEEVVKELSIEYEQVVEIIYKDSEVDQFMFGVYYEEHVIEFTKTKDMSKFLMLQGSHIHHDEKRRYNDQFKQQRKPYSYDVKNSKKNCVKYKQYQKKLRR